MNCQDLDELIEPLAAGDVAPDADTTAHLASCANCGLALDAARRLDHLLRVRDVPQAGPRFTEQTLGRIRRARWREQVLDSGFNLAVGGLAIAAAWLLIVYSGGLDAAGNDLAALLDSTTAEFSLPLTSSLPLYYAATTLGSASLGLWWWAERDMLR